MAAKVSTSIRYDPLKCKFVRLTLSEFVFPNQKIFHFECSSRGARNIPKAFEIFTGDQTLILKPKDGKNAEEWVQCLSIVVAHSQVINFEF